MKLKLGFVASVLGLMVGFGGCANQDDDIIPAKKPGFRPPSTPLVQEDLPPVDPLGVPAGNDQGDPGAPGSGSAVVSQPPGRGGNASQPAALPDPVPQQQAPAPPPPAPPKPAAPEYAKRVPGKPNWIKSPYDGKILDATGFPPGTEVKDPQTGKIMLVP